MHTFGGYPCKVRNCEKLYDIGEQKTFLCSWCSNFKGNPQLLGCGVFLSLVFPKPAPFQTGQILFYLYFSYQTNFSQFQRRLNSNPGAKNCIFEKNEHYNPNDDDVLFSFLCGIVPFHKVSNHLVKIHSLGYVMLFLCRTQHKWYPTHIQVIENVLRR